jgi:hypothetical protein
MVIRVLFVDSLFLEFDLHDLLELVLVRNELVRLND